MRGRAIADIATHLVFSGSPRQLGEATARTKPSLEPQELNGGSNGFENGGTALPRWGFVILRTAYGEGGKDAHDDPSSRSNPRLPGESRPRSSLHNKRTAIFTSPLNKGPFLAHLQLRSSLAYSSRTTNVVFVWMPVGSNGMSLDSLLEREGLLRPFEAMTVSGGPEKGSRRRLDWLMYPECWYPEPLLVEPLAPSFPYRK